MWWTSFFGKLRQNADRKKIQRQFLLILLLVAFSYFGYKFWKQGFADNTLLFGLGITIVSGSMLYFIPILLKPLLYLWLLLGMVLGEITSFILLGIIYYLVFFPITFILRKSSKKEPYDRPKWRSREVDIIDYKKMY